MTEQAGQYLELPVWRGVFSGNNSNSTVHHTGSSAGDTGRTPVDRQRIVDSDLATDQDQANSSVAPFPSASSDHSPAFEKVRESIRLSA